MFSSLRIKLQNACTRTTISRVHFSFVVVAFVHCTSLVFLHSISFAVNIEGRHLMIHIMDTAGAPRDNLAVVATSPIALYVCQDVPSDGLTAKDFAAMRRMCSQVAPVPISSTSGSTNVGGNPADSNQQHADPSPLPQDDGVADADEDEEEDDDDVDEIDSDSDSDSDSEFGEDSDSDSDDEEDDENVPASATTTGTATSTAYSTTSSATSTVQPPARAAVKRSLRSTHPDDENVAYVRRKVRSFLYPKDMTLFPAVHNSTLTGVDIIGLETQGGLRNDKGALFVPNSCAVGLRFPDQTLQDMERENVSFMAFHVWLLVISVASIMQESVPHLVSALAGQLLATSFSTWDIFRTLRFRMFLDELVNKPLCSGADLLPSFWKLRNAFNVSIACINITALALAIFLSYKLIKMWLISNFRSVGAGPTVEKLYRVLMAFSTLLRLYFFFVVLTAALWIDQIAGGLMHTFLTRSQYDGYLGICTLAILFALPLVLMGDVSMCREHRGLVIGFLVIQGCFLAFHVTLLASSPIFRWTLIVWPFFALNVGASFLLAVVVLVMGVICFRNFGRGLDHYLHVAEVLEQQGFTPALIPADPFILPIARRTASGKFEAAMEQGDTLKIKVTEPSFRDSLQAPVSAAAWSDITATLDASSPAPVGVSRWSDSTMTKSIAVTSTRGSWDSRFERVTPAPAMPPLPSSMPMPMPRRDSGFDSIASMPTFDNHDAVRVSDVGQEVQRPRY